VILDDLKRYKEELFEVLQGGSMDDQRAFLGHFIKRMVVGGGKVQVVYSAVIGG
jgi:hypothetical protein